MGRLGGGCSECDRCGDIDGDSVMASVHLHASVLCWKCARDLGLFNPRSLRNRVLIRVRAAALMVVGSSLGRWVVARARRGGRRRGVAPKCLVCGHARTSHNRGGGCTTCGWCLVSSDGVNAQHEAVSIHQHRILGL